jgi:hypothetical protein
MEKNTPRKPSIERGTVDVPWIAAFLGINLNAAYALVKTPGFPCIRVGKRFVIPREAFLRWVENAALDSQSNVIAQNQ